MISSSKVEFGEYCSSVKSVDEVIDCWHQMSLSYDGLIRHSHVYTNAYLSILLWRDDKTSHPWSGTIHAFNDSYWFHFMQFLFDLLTDMEGNPSGLLCDRRNRWVNTQFHFYVFEFANSHYVFFSTLERKLPNLGTELLT